MPEDFKNIRSAVRAAETGDRVLVGPGTYTESVVVRVPGISIVGDEATLRQRGRRTALRVNADDVTVEGLDFLRATVLVRAEGFTLRDGEMSRYRRAVPVRVRGSGAALENVAISDVKLSRRQRAVVDVEGNGVRLTNVTSSGISGQSTSRLGLFAFARLRARDAVVENCDLRVRLGACLVLQAPEFQIRGNNLTTEGAFAKRPFSTKTRIGTRFEHGAVISARTIGPGGGTIDGNTITHSVMRGCEIAMNDVTISGNTIAAGDGGLGAVLAEGARARVIGNKFDALANEGSQGGYDPVIGIHGIEPYVADNEVRTTPREFGGHRAFDVHGDDARIERNLHEGVSVDGLIGSGESWVVRENTFRIGTVAPTTTALDVDGSDGRFVDNVIEAFDGTAGPSVGIYVRGERNEISRNRISNCLGSAPGAAIRMSGEDGDAHDNVFTNCRERGLWIVGDRNEAFRNQSRSTLSTAESRGLQTAVSVSGTQNVLAETTVDGRFRVGIQVWGSQNEISDATVSGVTRHGLLVTSGLGNRFLRCVVDTDEDAEGMTVEDGAATELHESTIGTCGEFALVNATQSMSVTDTDLESSGVDPVDNTGTFARFSNVTEAQRTDCR